MKMQGVPINLEPLFQHPEISRDKVVETPGDRELTYVARTMQAQDYIAGQIINKNLHVLASFHILRREVFMKSERKAEEGDAKERIGGAMKKGEIKLSSDYIQEGKFKQANESYKRCLKIGMSVEDALYASGLKDLKEFDKKTAIV